MLGRVVVNLATKNGRNTPQFAQLRDAQNRNACPRGSFSEMLCRFHGQRFNVSDQE
jgi:hypothetical protein